MTERNELSKLSMKNGFLAPSILTFVYIFRNIDLLWSFFAIFAPFAVTELCFSFVVLLGSVETESFG